MSEVTEDQAVETAPQSIQFVEFDVPTESTRRGPRTSQYGFEHMAVAAAGERVQGLFVTPRGDETMGKMAKRIRSAYLSYAKRHGVKFGSQRGSVNGVEGLKVWRTA